MSSYLIQAAFLLSIFYIPVLECISNINMLLTMILGI